MLKFINFLRGNVEVEIEGAFPERFLNVCSQNGIEFWNLSRVSSTCIQARMRPSGYRKMPQFAQHTQCAVSLKKRHGVPFVLLRFRRRYALILGVVISLAAMYGLSQFVWEFEVVGNELVSSETILKNLRDIGVKPGIYGPSIDIATIKNEMLLRVDQLSWLTVNRSGSRATVEVRERIPTPEIVPEGMPCNIVSAKDGVILRVDAKAGSAQVKTGETVSAGQLIVSGVVDSRQTGARFLHAKGDVYLRTWYDLRAVMPKNVSAKQYTGRSHKRHTMVIAGFRANISLTGFPSYEHCDKLVKTTTLRLPFGVVMPVSLVTEEYIEYEPMEASVTKEQAGAVLKASLGRRLQAAMGEGEPVRIDVTALETNGAVEGRLLAECSEQVAVQVPIDRPQPPGGDAP